MCSANDSSNTQRIFFLEWVAFVEFSKVFKNISFMKYSHIAVFKSTTTKLVTAPLIIKQSKSTELEMTWSGQLHDIVFNFLFLFFRCYCCLWVPFLADDLKNVVHECPKCERQLAEYKQCRLFQRKRPKRTRKQSLLF